MASWEVDFHAGCQQWADHLNGSDKQALLAAISILEDRGPALGRPLVDSIIASAHANMKELRPGSSGRTAIRVLFAFDATRKAILLVGGDKSGSWSRWYKTNIPIADERFTERQRKLNQEAHDRRRPR